MNYRYIFKDEETFVCGEVKSNRLISHTNLNDEILGNIYRGRVEKYIKSLDGYVINIGLSKNALLRSKRKFTEFKVGDDILVEVIKNPTDKMYEVTENYSVSDGYLVLEAYPTKKEYILRTKAEHLSNNEISKRLSTLYRTLEEIKKERSFLPTPKLLKTGRYITNFITEYEGEIKSNIDILNVKKTNFNPRFDSIISAGLESLNHKKIDFNYGNIIIDELETLTVIDINSGYENQNLSKVKLSYETNLHSINEIAIQLSLRKIKKMVIIDFIRMNINENKHIIKRLEEAFIENKINAKILGFRNMGLLEIIIEWFDSSPIKWYTIPVSKPHRTRFKHLRLASENIFIRRKIHVRSYSNRW